MNVVLSIEAIQPPLAGIGRYTWELAKRIPLLHGIDSVRYLSDSRWKNLPQVEIVKPENQSIHMRPAQIAVFEPVLNYKGRLRRRFGQWSLISRIYAEIVPLTTSLRLRSMSDGIFHGPNYFVPKTKMPSVVTIHDLSVYRYPQWHPKARIERMHRTIPSSVQRAKIVLTDSLVTRQEVIDEFHLNPNHVCAVPLGVDDDYYPRSVEELEPILMEYGLRPDGYSLFVSTIEPRKNILNLIAAYRALPASLKAAWPLVLAGGVGWQSYDIHAEIERAANEGWLKYLGFVPQADLPFLYAGCRLFTYPSWYEGFGLPIAEAMACGVPVLTSNCSSMPEVAAGCAMLVEPGDVADMTQKIQQTLEDTMWREQAIQRGLQRAAQLTWDACVKNTLTAYHLADTMR